MNDIHYRPKIMIVDDKLSNIYALEKILVDIDAEVVTASSGLDALELTLEHEFCLAIVDIQMPEMDGYELVELLRGNPLTASLPVIFVSAIYSDEYHHRKGYEAGAVDFLSKPFVPEILVSKIRIFLDLYQQRKKVQELAEQNAHLYEVEKKLRVLEEARTLDLANLNASKDKFFSIVSHDLRTPFNGVIGYAQLLLMELDEDQADIRKMAETILSSSRSAYRLLENLLAWAQIQRGVMVSQPENQELSCVVNSTIDLLQPVATHKNIQIINHVKENTIVYADDNMVATILRNLVSNAIKFTPDGGKITINAQPAVQDKGEAPYIAISVSDTGIGISPVDIDKLFKIDVNLSTNGTNDEEGAGLGLILCKEMTELMGGQIEVASKLNEGTKFTFTLPVH